MPSETAKPIAARAPIAAISLAALAAVLLSGCAYHSEYHRAGVAHRSIKDDPVTVTPSAAQQAPVRKTAVRHAAYSSDNAKPSAAPKREPKSAEVMSAPALAPAPKSSAPAVARVETAPAPLAPQAAPQVAAAEPPPAPKAPPAIPAPAVTLPTVAPPAVAIAAPPKPVAPAAEAPATSRTTTDLRRAAPPVVAAVPPPAAPVPPTPPAAAEPAPVKPAASAIVIQPKAPAADAPAPAQPKVAALTDEQRVRDVIARAQEHLVAGRLINARSLLQDAARDNNPLVLTALAESYDPLFLRDKQSNLARSGEPTRALEYYRRAAERGSAAAAQKLKTLADFLATNPGFAKP